ncbi:MAG: PAS domain S-box protein [Bacteroidota bacterium]
MIPRVTFINGKEADFEDLSKLFYDLESDILVLTGCDKKLISKIKLVFDKLKIVEVLETISVQSGTIYLISSKLKYQFNDPIIEIDSFSFQWEDLNRSNLNEIYLLNEKLELLDVNEVALKNLQYSAEEISKKHIYDILSDYKKSACKELIQPLINGEKDKLTFNCVHKRSDNSSYPVECSLTKVSDNKKTRLFYRAHDLSKHQEIMEVMKEQTDHLHALATNFPSGSISLFDAKLNLLFTGGEAYSEFDINPEILRGKNAKDFLPPEQYKHLVEAKDSLVSKSSFTYESGYEGRFYLNTLKPVYGHKGCFRYYVLTVIDNTLLKEQQNNIMLEKNNFAAISNALNRSALVSMTDKQGVIIHANSAFCNASKYSSKELIGKNHNIVNSGYHSKDFWKEMWKTVSRGQTWRAEVRNKAKDGSYYWVDTVINPVLDLDGQIAQYLSIRYLITERKELEFNLLQITNKFVLASQAAGIGVWTYDFDTMEISWDIQIKGISELGFFKGSVDEWMEFIHPHDRARVMNTIQPESQTKSEFELETRIISRTGELYYINLKASIESREGKSKRAIGLTWDITHERIVQQNLEEALNDREVMYKELHHRIKNNLQMVNSLLYIRGTHTKDDELKEFIKDTSTKINSISAIHEKLLQLSPMNQLNIRDYLNTLCDNIVKTYSDRKRTYTLDIDIIPELFDVDMALNIGLIVNEILSNTIKYAYPDSGGLVKVSLQKNNGQYILKALDEGIGIANEMKIRAKSSYGIQLIELFVKQIDGKMKIQYKNGTSYTIKFSRPQS